MNRKQKGLTLVELMVTLAVAIILLAVGMPLFSGVAANNRATTQTNSLVSALKLARSEAVKRGRDVMVCASPVALPVANPVCDTADPVDWKNGWFVFTDLDGDGAVDSDEVIRVWEALEDNALISHAGADLVTFGSTGAAVAAVNFDLDFTGATGSSKRCAIVGLSGQVRLKSEKAGEAWTCP